MLALLAQQLAAVRARRVRAAVGAADSAAHGAADEARHVCALLAHAAARDIALSAEDEGAGVLRAGGLALAARVRLLALAFGPGLGVRALALGRVKSP